MPLPSIIRRASFAARGPRVPWAVSVWYSNAAPTFFVADPPAFAHSARFPSFFTTTPLSSRRHYTHPPHDCTDDNGPNQRQTGQRRGHLGKVEFPKNIYDYREVSEAFPPQKDATKASAARLDTDAGEGPEPSYQFVNSGFHEFEYNKPFQCELTDNPNGGLLDSFKLAYETWGELNEDKSNAILLFTGLSASSHAKSHKHNESPGWWEKFIGPGKALDTDTNFVICANVLGGCYGSTGPSSANPRTGVPYALAFPMVTCADMVRSQFLLLDDLGIDSLHAVVGSSMGGMLSLAAAAMYPDRVQKAVSISAACRSHPTAIALRYMQRRILMADPHWNGGEYYTGAFPVAGLKHARELATISYRSGPEWEERFGRRLAPGSRRTSLRPSFLIETYLDHQGNQWCMQYDPNSLLYISKAMDLFDMVDCDDALSLANISKVQCPALIMGVQSDILFPIQQQREVVEMLKDSGNLDVSYYELNAMFGHDTFLIDVNGVTGAIRGHL
eukprot:gene3880-15297_t